MVQLASGPEWIDLDPSIPGGQAGTAYATPTSTPDELPDDLYHALTIKAIAEVVEGGAPVRKELLSQTLRVADLVGTPITLTHPTAEWLGIGAAISGDSPTRPACWWASSWSRSLDHHPEQRWRCQRGLRRPRLGRGAGDRGVAGHRSLHPGRGRAPRRADGIRPAEPRAARRRHLRRGRHRAHRARGSGEDIRSEFLPLSGFITFAVAPAPIPWQFFDEDATGEADQLVLQAQVAHAFPYLRDLVRLESLGDRAAPRYIDDEPTVTAFWAAATAPPQDGLAQLAATVDIVHARHGAIPLLDADVPVPAGLLAGAIDRRRGTDRSSRAP